MMWGLETTVRHRWEGLAFIQRHRYRGYIT